MKAFNILTGSWWIWCYFVDRLISASFHGSDWDELKLNDWTQSCVSASCYMLVRWGIRGFGGGGLPFRPDVCEPFRRSPLSTADLCRDGAEQKRTKSTSELQLQDNDQPFPSLVCNVSSFSPSFLPSGNWSLKERISFQRSGPSMLTDILTNPSTFLSLPLSLPLVPLSSRLLSRLSCSRLRRGDRCPTSSQLSKCLGLWNL